MAEIYFKATYRQAYSDWDYCPNPSTSLSAQSIIFLSVGPNTGIICETSWQYLQLKPALPRRDVTSDMPEPGPVLPPSVTLGHPCHRPCQHRAPPLIGGAPGPASDWWREDVICLGVRTL